MPIDYSTYPPDWKLRSRFVRFYRARNRCEWCGALNGQLGFRDESGEFHMLSSEDEGISMGVRPFRIVLTVAHVFNMDHMAAGLLNLAALCNRCHLRHDAPHHRRNAWKTRREQKGNLELFEVE